MPPTAALEVSLSLLRLPSGVREARKSPLPADTLLLLRILAGDEYAEYVAVNRTGQNKEFIREAAEFFAVQILFAPDASAYRRLACEPNVDREEIRYKMGVLLRWLHPDRGADPRYAIFFNQVLEAWRILRVQSSREEYDQKLFQAANNSIDSGREFVWVGRAPFFHSTTARIRSRVVRNRRWLHRLVDRFRY